jgi:surface polysaccharide O-acyltransferase-like enzyme
MAAPGTARISSIDAIRALLIFGVVLIHCAPFQKPGMDATLQLIGALADLASRVAVPFFLVAAGYFLGLKAQSFALERLSSFARRLAVVLAFWYVFFLLWPADWRGAMEQGYLRTIYWNATALMHDAGRLMIGPRLHLWFLSALLLGAVHIVLVGRMVGWRLLLPYAAVLYLLGLLNGAYQAIPETHAVNPGLWGPLAFPPLLIVLGWALSQRAVPIGYATAWALFLGGSLLVFTEAAWLSVGYSVPLVGHDMLIGTPFQAAGLLALALARPGWGSNTPLPGWGRYTLGIYAAHIAVLEGLRAFASGGLLWEFVAPPLVFATTLIVVMLLSRLRLLRPVLV